MLFDVTTVDPAVIPGAVQDAAAKCPGEGMELSHVIVHNFAGVDPQVYIYVYRSVPDRTGTGGYVTYALDGTFVEDSCE